MVALISTTKLRVRMLLTSQFSSSHRVRSCKVNADILEVEMKSGHKAESGVNEDVLLACELQGDEQSDAADENKLRDQQLDPLHSRQCPAWLERAAQADLPDVHQPFSPTLGKLILFLGFIQHYFSRTDVIVRGQMVCKSPYAPLGVKIH